MIVKNPPWRFAITIKTSERLNGHDALFEGAKMTNGNHKLWHGSGMGVNDSDTPKNLLVLITI
jgi:hypothetical protein